MSKATHAYVGKKPCGCTIAVTSDDPEDPKHTAKNVAEFIRDGLRVERVTLEAFRADKSPFGCKCGTKATAQQQEMFAAKD